MYFNITCYFGVVDAHFHIWWFIIALLCCWFNNKLEINKTIFLEIVCNYTRFGLVNHAVSPLLLPLWHDLCSFVGTFGCTGESSARRTMCSSSSFFTSWSPSPSWTSVWCRALHDSSSTYWSTQKCPHQTPDHCHTFENYTVDLLLDD